MDLQGFKQPYNDYILKELAIISLSYKSNPIVLLFEKPYSFKRLPEQYKQENLWLQHYHHGLSWNSGTIPYYKVGELIRETLQDATKIFVKGTPQKIWLQRFKFNVYDVNELYPHKNLKTLKKSVTICTNHNAKYKTICALHTVKTIEQIYLRYDKVKNDFI